MSGSSTNPPLSNEYFGDGRLALVEPVWDGKPLLAQECGVEQPALIARAVIAKHRDDGVARAHRFGEPDGARDIDAARPAQAETFLAQQIEDDGKRLGIGHLIGLVDLGALEIGSDAALADPFGDRASFGLEHAMLVVIVEGGTHGIGKTDDDVGVVLLPAHRHAGKRAAGPDRADDAIDLAVEFLPNLLGRGLDMALAVGDIVEL